MKDVHVRMLKKAGYETDSLYTSLTVWRLPGVDSVIIWHNTRLNMWTGAVKAGGYNLSNDPWITFTDCGVPEMIRRCETFLAARGV
jgi:hypothetical protein